MARAKKPKITGYRNIVRNLEKLTAAGRDQLTKDFEKQAAEIADDAAALAPVDEFDLQQNIIYRKAYDDKVGVVFVVGPEYPVAAHGHLVEFGTEAHPITSDSVMVDEDGTAYGQSVQHPGAPAQPFLRPAMDNNESSTLKTAKTSLRKGMKLS